MTKARVNEQHFLERPPLPGEVKEAKDRVEKVYTDEKVYT